MVDRMTPATIAENHARVLAQLDREKPTVLMAGGGTAGHINPALAVGKAIQKLRPDLQIVFCGNGDGYEADLVPRENFPFYWVEASAFEYRKPKIFMRAIPEYFRGVKQCKELIDALPVVAVVGTGGYVCAPLVAAGRAKKIPHFLHEQNAYPGKSTRTFSKGAACVCVSYAQTIPYFSKAKAVKVTGNPVAEDYLQLTKEAARQKLKIPQDQKIVLATGGSLGAAIINETVLDMVKKIAEKPGSAPFKTHLVTGRRQYDQVQKEAPERPDLLQVSEYLFDMPYHLAAADLVLCRAGAGACAELAVLGKPSILMPYPGAKADHQTKNAQTLVDSGAAYLLRDRDAQGDLLLAMLADMFQTPEKLEQMSEAAKSLAKPDAAKEIAEIIVAGMRRLP